MFSNYGVEFHTPGHSKRRECQPTKVCSRDTQRKYYTLPYQDTRMSRCRIAGQSWCHSYFPPLPRAVFVFFFIEASSSLVTRSSIISNFSSWITFISRSNLSDSSGTIDSPFPQLPATSHANNIKLHVRCSNKSHHVVANSTKLVWRETTTLLTVSVVFTCTQLATSIYNPPTMINLFVPPSSALCQRSLAVSHFRTCLLAYSWPPPAIPRVSHNNI